MCEAYTVFEYKITRFNKLLPAVRQDRPDPEPHSHCCSLSLDVIHQKTNSFNMCPSREQRLGKAAAGNPLAGGATIAGLRLRRSVRSSGRRGRRVENKGLIGRADRLVG